MDYNGLQNAVAAYSHRDDMASMVPTFIEMAEARFNRELRSSEQEETATTTADSEYIALPDDFLQLRMLLVEGEKSTYYPPDRFQRLVDINQSLQVPAFTIQDKQFRFYPAPTADATAVVKVLYYRTIPALGSLDSNSVTITSNWLLAKHPDLYLFGALLEARAYVKPTTGETQMWEARIDKSMAQLRRHSAYMLSGPAMTVRAA
jgi:hypothetical protein